MKNESLSKLSLVEELEIAMEIVLDESCFGSTTGERLEAARRKLRQFELEMRQLIWWMEHRPKSFDLFAERLGEVRPELVRMREIVRDLEAQVSALN